MLAQADQKDRKSELISVIIKLQLNHLLIVNLLD